MWGLALVDLGEFEQAQTVLEEALRRLIEFRYAVPVNELTASELAYDVEWQLRLMVGINFSEMEKFTLARQHLSQALHFCQQLGKLRGQLICLGNLGLTEWLAGNYTAARQAREQALSLARACGYRWSEAANLVDLGDTLRLQGEYELARKSLERGWTLAHEINDYSHQNLAMEALVCLYSYLGDYPQAQLWLDRARLLNDSADIRHGVAHAVLAYQQGDYGQALAAANHAWQLVSKSGNRANQAKTLIVLGHAQAALQLWTVAADTYTQALALIQQWAGRRWPWKHAPV